MAEETVVKNGPVETNIGAPLIFWIVFLIIGVMISLFIVPLFSGSPTTKNLLVSISNWILYLPGSIILPLVVSIWIGESVGQRRETGGKSAKIGEVNAVYASLIYVVAIFIIYLLLYYIDMAALATITILFFVEYVVVIPVFIVLILTPIVSALSAIRHSTA